MSEKNYSTADIQAVANGIRKQILGVALKPAAAIWHRRARRQKSSHPWTPV